MSHFSTSLFAALVPLGLISAPSVMAQQSATETTAVQNVFAAAYFEQYAPRTALDMIGQVPGFSIRSGDLGKRGLGQGGANILINGERLTGKADPFDELDQILASNVEAIEIKDGASLSIPGLSGQVADITVRASKFSGSWEWNPQFRESLQPNWFNGRVNVSGETGDLSYSFFARDFSFRGGVESFEELRDAQGALIENRVEDFDNYGDRPGIGTNLTWKPREDHTINLNAEYALFNFRRKADGVRTALTDDRTDLITLGGGSEDEWYLEVGADYEMPLFGNTFKLTSYLERESSPTGNRFTVFDPQTGFLEESQFLRDADEAETILRGEYSWSPSEGRSWELGVEGAYNSLDIEQEFQSRGPGEAFSGDGPSGFSVMEDRYEATLTHSRPLGPKWDVQASVGAEYSELSQERDDQLMTEPREFVRPKGFVSATYKPGNNLNIRGKIEREVGQLNFFDFVSSVDLEDSLDRAGNPDLVPAQSWLGSLEFDKDFGQGNTFKVEFYGALIEDIVDRIPIGVDGDGIGNIDSATRYGFDASATFKGERWGWNGTQVELEFDWRDSNVDDPLLGFGRRLNGDKQIAYEASFRHDIPKTDWAYGAFAERYIQAREFRLFSIDRFGTTKPFVGAFVEHKDVLGMKVRVNFWNLLDQEEYFDRTLFDARRDQGQILRTENADYVFGQILNFNISGEF